MSKVWGCATLISIVLLNGCSDEIAAPDDPVNEPAIVEAAQMMSDVDAALLGAVVDDATQRIVPSLPQGEGSGRMATAFAKLARAIEDRDAMQMQRATDDLIRVLDTYPADANEQADITVLRLVLELVKDAE